MKRKILCLILAFCCFAATGCNKIEKENPSAYSDVVSSTTPSNNTGNSSSSSDTYISSNDKSTSSSDLTASSSNNQSSSSTEQSSSSKQEASSSSSTGDYRSPNSESSSGSSSSQPVIISSSTSSSSKTPASTQSSSTSASSSRPLVTQSSKPQSTASSTLSSSSTQQYAQSSLPNELIPPASAEIIGNYNQRAPEAWEIEYANEVFRLTNIERTKEGLPAFKRMERLDTAANIRAWEVLVDYSHTRPDGRKFSTALTEAGINWESCGENIAAGQRTPEKVVQAWMNSPGHRANILNPDYEYLGVSFYYDNDEIGGTNYRYFWTQNFCTEF